MDRRWVDPAQQCALPAKLHQMPRMWPALVQQQAPAMPTLGAGPCEERTDPAAQQRLQRRESSGMAEKDCAQRWASRFAR